MWYHGICNYEQIAHNIIEAIKYITVDLPKSDMSSGHSFLGTQIIYRFILLLHCSPQQRSVFR
jgi:hypothetical protein